MAMSYFPNASVKLFVWVSGHTKQRQCGANRNSSGLRAAFAPSIGDLQLSHLTSTGPFV